MRVNRKAGTIKPGVLLIDNNEPRVSTILEGGTCRGRARYPVGMDDFRVVAYV